MPSGKVRRLAQHARVHIDDARHANPDAYHRAVLLMFRGERGDRVAHLLDDLVAAARNLSARGDGLEKFAGIIDGGDAKVGAA